MTLADMEKRAICDAVVSQGSICAAAEYLGIPRSTIYRKLKSYGLCKGRRVMANHLIEQIKKLSTGN